MRGMEEVGRLFNDNQLIVAEVLQSAEAMKAAVAYLEQFMEKDETAARGTIVLATVKGDVHDIGKNLVEIILKNNGYRIVNLGIKVPPEDLIAAYHSHKPDAIGLSGLLVKSAQQMVVTAQDLRAAGIEVPLFVGGAALTRKFTATRIAARVRRPHPLRQGRDGRPRPGQPPLQRHHPRRPRRAAARRAGGPAGGRRRGRRGRRPEPAPSARAAPRCRARCRCRRRPISTLHVLRDVPLTHVFPYLNLQMLLGKHLGVKGSVARLLEQRDPKVLEINQVVEELERDGRRAAHHPRAAASTASTRRPPRATTWCSCDGGREAARFHFPRQPDGERLCLSDYVREQGSGEKDYVALFAVTCGAGVRELAERWKEEGQYLRSHALQALAIECAEAFAEMLHARLRTQWGFPDPPGLELAEKLKAHYRGLRVSFGYPACPNLADQRILFDLLEPRADRPRPDRGLHDGSGGLGLRAGLPPSRGQVLQGRVGEGPRAERDPGGRRQPPLPRSPRR